MRPFGTQSPRRLTDWLMATAVFAVALACYWPSLQGALLWDDPAHVTPPELRDWSGLLKIWTEVGATQEFYPALHGAFWLEHWIWGDSTLGYHLINVFLHAGSCCLLAVILRSLWAARDGGPTDSRIAKPRIVPKGTEWFAAFLFAVHPVCVESVAWITEQKNTLSLFLFLLTAAAYLRFLKRRRWGMYSLALILFFFALAAKTAMVTLPAALLVVLWWRNGRIEWRRDVMPLVPFFVLSGVAGLVTVWVETKFVGAAGSGFDWSFIERVMLAARITWFYIGKLVWPLNLIFYYEHWDVHASASQWWPYLAAGICLTVILWAIRRHTRGPLAAWLLFIGTLFPVLGFFNVFGFTFSQVADHFQYLPCMIFVAAFAGGVAIVLSRAPTWVRTSGCGLLGFVLIGLGAQAHRQSALYVNDETLFKSVVARNPESWMAHHILAVTFSKADSRGPEAVAEARKAVALNPDFPDSHFVLGVELAKTAGGAVEAVREYEQALQLRPHYAEAHNALGVELAKRPDQLPEAIAHFEEALRVRPRMAEAHVNLANALARDPRRLPEAIAHFEEALHIRPDYAKAHNDYGLLLARLPGRGAEAINQFEQALNSNPTSAEAHRNLANMLAATPGRTTEAISHYEEALRIDPRSALSHYGLANVLAFQPGRTSEAVAHYEAALRIVPGFAEAHANLANILASMPGRMPEAISHYEKALQIDPSLAWVHLNLAMRLASLPERAAEAETQFNEALRLKPDYLDALNGLAILCAQQGRFDEARAHWTKALHVDPKYETARQNLRLLEQMGGSEK